MSTNTKRKKRSKSIKVFYTIIGIKEFSEKDAYVLVKQNTETSKWELPNGDFFLKETNSQNYSRILNSIGVDVKNICSFYDNFDTKSFNFLETPWSVYVTNNNVILNYGLIFFTDGKELPLPNLENSNGMSGWQALSLLNTINWEDSHFETVNKFTEFF